MLEKQVPVVGNEQVEDVLVFLLLLLFPGLEVLEDVRLDVLYDLSLVVARAVVLDKVQEIRLVSNYDGFLSYFLV